MNIHSIIPNSSVNGPGNRFVIWTQGCTLNCPGCWNQETHSFSNGNYFSCLELLERIGKVTNIEGITISGGEPFEQPNELFELTKLIREETRLSQIVYSGYTINKIRNDKNMEIILPNIDVLIDGRYNSLKPSKNDFIGSTNQKHHFFSNKYSINDFQKQNELEYHFSLTDSTVLTGFPVKI